MNKAGIVFPHQLFEQNILPSTCETIYLVEEWLYFKQYNFHKQKIAFHRASMKFYENYLQTSKCKVQYIDSFDDRSDIRQLIPYIKSQGFAAIEYVDTTDYWLEQRIHKSISACNLTSIKHTTPLFLNAPDEIRSFFVARKRMYQTDFYKYQRQRKNILMNQDQQPMGGKWSFDDENRLKYPKGKTPPAVHFLEPNVFHLEAIAYTNQYFPGNYGSLDHNHFYPITFLETKTWLNTFLDSRLPAFGPFEDAIVANERILHHSVLSPLINAGLLTPEYVLQKTLKHGTEHKIPINSLEGFIRQIIGWREFIRAVYEIKGVEERTKNYWGFTRKIPAAFWNGTTGIEPIDSTVKKVLATGYCHHIERLMVLGNFMLLCEFDPDEVYRWFMELFIDAYDWVMVPNVYGMSQFADGGLMATKPYISGSNYLLKMSDYPKGSWQIVWDALFWRFLHVHRSYFIKNPRLAMLVKLFDSMDKNKQQSLIRTATNFLHSNKI